MMMLEMVLLIPNNILTEVHASTHTTNTDRITLRSLHLLPGDSTHNHDDTDTRGVQLGPISLS